MEKFILSEAHAKKRAEKKHLPLRYDTLGDPIMWELLPDEYFDIYSRFPDEFDKVIFDAMYAGDWHSIYDSEILPAYRSPWMARFRKSGYDFFGEWERIVHEKGKEFWLTHRVSEVDISLDTNPVPLKDAHPEWFIPAFGFKMNNMAVPEMRAHKLRILGEVLRKYDFDGLDIDFERHTPVLPVGHQWEMRENLTDFMRELRRLTLEIAEEKGKVIMLSARIPDCIKGCHEDGIDIEEWIKEDLVDCLTLGSRSFDVKVEEFRALSDEIQLYACYDPHHTVDGYFAPSIEVIRGVWYSHRQRGADGVEYFNWAGQGSPDVIEIIKKAAYEYGLKPGCTFEVECSKDDFTGAYDADFLKKQNKTYVIDRKGGYPWGIGYGNRNDDRQLPLPIDTEGEVKLYVAENAAGAKSATLKLLFEELTEIPEIYFNEKRLSVSAAPHKDLQVTTETTPPNSGRGVYEPLFKGIDKSKPCTMLTADLTGTDTKIGYNSIRIVAKKPTSLEKVELDLVLN